MASGGLLSLPDDLLLNILQYLNIEDLHPVFSVSSRFSRLCCDRTLVRKSHFEGSYHFKEDDIKQYIQHSYHHIQVLNLNHCYWLPQRFVQWAVARCKNLQELHVIECKLRLDSLVTLTASLPGLVALSFSISSFADIKKDTFASAKETLANLKRLHIYYTSRELSVIRYLGEHHTILDYCHRLEQLHIGSAGMAIPELYRPIISTPQNHLKMKSMCITSNIHAGAQMLFYGTLSQLPNSHLHWETLLMPNVNFGEFSRKPEFQHCLKNVENLRNLDVSGSRVHVMFPNDVIDITRSALLQHLNLGSTLVDSSQLQYIASHCSNMTSLNLFDCSRILMAKDNIPCNSGLTAVSVQCPLLKHLNLAGEHHHLHPPLGGATVKTVLETVKGLTSLALPTCSLCQTDLHSSRPSTRSYSQLSKSAKKRCLQHVQLAHASSSSESTGALAGPSSSSSSSSSSSPSVNNSTGTESDTLLQTLVSNNPDLAELEIIAVNFKSAIHKNKFINPRQPVFAPCTETRAVRDIALEPISQLKHLKKLSLIGCPGLVSGQCLVSIAQKCQRLESLSLAFVGGALNGLTFSQALVYLRNLVDLRIEQPHLTINAAFFEGISNCQRLTRLCIIAKYSAFQAPDVTRLLDQLPRLVVLQLLAGSTITACKSLTTFLNRRFGKLRPALSITIYPILYDGIVEIANNIPAKHFDEVTRFCSRVCGLPAVRT